MKKIILTTILLFLVSMSTVYSQNTMRIDTLSGKPGDTLTYSVKIDNAKTFVAYQLDIQIPAYLTYVNSSAVLTGRSNGHNLGVSLINSTTLRVLAYSLTMNPFFGNTGAVLTFKCNVTGNIPGVYNLGIVTPVIADSLNANILTASYSGRFTLLLPKIAFSTSAMNFGTTLLGTNKDLSLTIYNQGTSSLTISRIVSNSGEIKFLDSSGFTLTAGTNLSRTVRLYAYTRGVKNASFVFYSNDPSDSVHTVTATGTVFTTNELYLNTVTSKYGFVGTMKIRMKNFETVNAFQTSITLPASISYVPGSVVLNPARINDHIITASVISGNILKIVSYSPTNKPYLSNDSTIAQFSFIARGNPGSYSIPITEGIISDTNGINVISNVYAGSISVISPVIGLPASILFDTISYTDTSRKVLTIQNTGNDTLLISGINATESSFANETTLPVKIPPSSTRNFTIRFTNSVNGLHTGNLIVSHNDSLRNPGSIAVSGFIYKPTRLRVTSSDFNSRDTSYLPFNITNKLPIVAFQFDITLPSQFSYIPNSAILTSRANGHLVSTSTLGNGDIRVIAYSMTQNRFNGDSGDVVKLRLAVNADTGVYNVTVKNVIISDSNNTNVATGFDNGFIRLSPYPPTLITPLNGSVGNPVNISLNWSKSLFASYYHLQVATDSLFTNKIVNDSTRTDTTYSLTNLNILQNYYWRVRVKNYSGMYRFSNAWGFKTIGYPTQVILFSPANNSTEQPLNITFKWFKAVDQTLSPLTVSKYWFEYSTDSNFVTNVLRDSTLTDTIKTVNGLNKFSKYYWRVKAINQMGWGSFSSKWNLTTTYFIDSVSPNKNKINVPLTSNMNVWFHQSTNSTTIDSNSVTFFGSMTGRKRGTLTYNSGNNSMQIVPNNPFKYGELISTTLDSGIKTSAGNSILPFVWSFTSMAKTSTMVFNEINSITVGASPYSVASGDFNGDGYIDLAVSNAGGGVSILINNGNGTFTKQSTDLSATGRRVIAGDFDNDGDLDLAACDGSNPVKIFTNDGIGNFTLSSSVSTGQCQDLTTADFNGDGYLDIATSGWTDNRIVILMNNGNGTFTQTSAIPTGNGVYEVVSGDFDGDGFIDIAAPNYNGGNLVVYKNNGSGSFTQLSSISVGGNPLCMTAGDFDGDGDLDLVVTNQGSPKFDVLKNNGSGTFTLSQTISPGNYAFGVSSADLDGDGDLDLVVCLNATSTPLKIYKNDGFGTYTLSSTAGSSGFYGIRTAVADLNNDGVLDIAAADASGNLARIIITLAPPRLMSPANNSVGNLNAFSFSWIKMAGASNYRIQIATDSLFSNIIVNDSTLLGTDSIKAVSGLSQLTWYYWRMNSKSANGLSLWSDTWKFKTQGTPTQVTLIQPANNAVNQPVNITFKWTKAADQTYSVKSSELIRHGGRTERGVQSEGKEKNKESTGDSPFAVSNYWFEYSVDSTFATVIGRDSTLSDTTKTLSGLNNITKYYWRVKAKNQTGWGGFSNTWNFTTIVPIPSAPLLLNPLNNSTGNPLSLNLVWNKLQYADVYNVVIAIDTGFTNILLNDSTLTDSIKAITNLSPLTIYYWKVRAKNVAGWGSYCSVFNFKTVGSPTQVVLSTPANNSTNQPVNLMFKWFKAVDQTLLVKSSESKVKSDKNSDSPSAVSNYWFELATDAGFTSIVTRDSSVTDTIKAVTGLSNTTTYYWRVKAKNQIGWSLFSSVWSFTTIVPVPGVPTLLSPVFGSTGNPLNLNLVWSKPANSINFHVMIATDTGFTNIILNDSTLTDSVKALTNLTPLTTYYWKVRAKSLSGWSWFASVFNFKTVGPASQVVLNSPVNNSTGQPVNITFNWFNAVDQTNSVKSSQLTRQGGRTERGVKSERKENGKEQTGDSPLSVSNYWFELSTDSTFITNVIRDSLLTDTTKLISGLGNLTKYYWRVKAKNQINWGSFSSVWNFTTIVAVPIAPTLLTPANGSTGISLTPTCAWNSVINATTYHFQISSDSTFATVLWDTAGLASPTITVPAGKLSQLTKYYWRVRATNAGGTGPWSVKYYFTTMSMSLSLNLKVYLEGFWDGSTQISDTVMVYLANATTPYAYADTAKVILIGTGTASMNFNRVTTGSYYIVVNHRNHLETWSALPQSFVGGTPLSYDFTTASNKAYGDNMKQVGSVWVLIGGDANRDGSIDASDIGLFVVQFGNLGYLSCDFNGDEDVNAMDVLIISNNFGFIKITPGVAPISPETLKKRKMESEKLRK